jgi:uncharacterized protein (DUF1697 family)
MAKYVAFLRGVNVGGRIVKMAELKVCFEKAGFKNVSTLLQSGNVVFDPSTGSGQEASKAELKSQIEELLTKTFNYPAKVQVISLDNLKQIVDVNPFAGAPAEYHQYVIFIENDLETGLVAEAGKQLGEEVAVGRGVVYWKVQKGQTLKSPFAKLLTKSKYKDFNTNRNINTLQKILKS